MLVVDQNEKIISDIGRIAFELGNMGNKRGWDWDKKRNLYSDLMISS